jgi:peptidoglycan/LPS O-acetylase OafA/YrhL
MQWQAEGLEKPRLEWRLLGTYRLILAMLVVTSHSSDFLPAWVMPLALGNAGVFGFFVLSGFVISEACDRVYRGEAQRFLLNRFLRLYPTYWAACGLAVAIYLYIGHAELSFAPNIILANLGIVYAPPGTFLWISVIWAVGIEIRYYLIAAAVSWLASRFPARDGMTYGIAGIVALALYGYTWANDFGVLATFRHAPFFVLGASAYFAVARGSRKATALLCAAALLSLHSYWDYNAAGPTDLVPSTAIFVVVVAILLALTAFEADSGRLISVDKFLGDFTYPLYLVHFPIVALVATMAEGRSANLYFSVVLASLAASALLIFAVERPLMKLRDLVRRRRLYT